MQKPSKQARMISSFTITLISSRRQRHRQRALCVINVMEAIVNEPGKKSTSYETSENTQNQA